jgi:hypothetical protein
MPVTGQATLGPTCLCSHCSCCVRMAGRLLLRLRMPGRAAAFSGHLIVVTLLLLGLAMRPPYTGFASAGSWINHNNVNSEACIGGASVPWTIARQTAGRLTLALSPGLSSYFGRCAGILVVKWQRPFLSCLPGLTLSALPRDRMQRKTKTKTMQTDFQPCNASSYAKQAPAHRHLTPLIAVRVPDDMHT